MGKIFDIQRFSIHDGLGIRTILFMKGCSLQCKWCCNPESIRLADEIGFSINDCIRCGRCMEICPYNAISENEKGRYFKMEKCLICEKKPCVDVCPAKAIVKFGKEISVDEAMAEIEKDDVFYRNSGGGVTFSGGEALLQSRFVGEVLRRCKAENYNTAIETSCCCDWDDFEKVIDYTDLFLCDLKHLNERKFQEEIGNGFEKIIKNLKLLSKRHDNIIIRTPVIPGFNDDDDSINKIAAFISELGIRELHLLPYHRLGKSKYDKLSQKYAYEDVKAPDHSYMEHLCEVARKHGLTVQNGG